MLKKISLTIILFSMFFGSGGNLIPLNKKWIEGRNLGNYSRGTYLIVLSNSYLETYLTSEQVGGDFVQFKRSQGYDVEVISMDQEGFSTTDAADLKNYLQAYTAENPMLEYVLLVGDINGSFAIPTHFIPSINEPELDVTDYPYSFYDDNPESENYDVLEPKFIIGRWSVSNPGDLINIKSRTIQYTRMDNLSDVEREYLSRGLLVAGNYANSDGEEIPPSSWPVTPVWTSRWLYDELMEYGYTLVDTAYFQANYQIEDNPVVISAWSSGVGVINYRGWGNSHGWHKPTFYISDIPYLNHGWMLPVVSSFVCNTGDFGADLNNNGPTKCFAEALITGGTPTSPKGAVAVIGPSDLDTDTRYNNVMCGVYWRSLLQGETAEIGVALHIGKQALAIEFPQLAGPGDVVEFYHHVYMVIGDPSLPVWLLEPSELSADIENSTDLQQSFISTVITDEEGNRVEEVVGALMYNGELIGKGLTTPDGVLTIDFDGLPDGSNLSLYLNKPQFFQKKIDLVYVVDDGTPYEPAMWTAFDVQVLSNDQTGYVLPGENVQIRLDVTNLSGEDYYGLQVNLTELTDDGLIGTFLEGFVDIPAFSSVTTDVLFDGNVGNYARGSRIRLRAEFYYSGTKIAENDLTVMIGPVGVNDPVPSCDYGYWAYDNGDVSYDEAPVYDWVEINPAKGGEGYDLGLTDDSHVDVDLPFTFNYYGVPYNSMTVGSNGWLSFEHCEINYFWNFSIPMYMGPAAMVAPYMDDLDDDNGNEPFHIFLWEDTEGGRVIVQWDNVSNGEDDEYCSDPEYDCVKVTFQVILYDPQLYPTITGDGEILFQYTEIHDIDQNGNYSTIGIEAPDQLDGLQYVFNSIPEAGAYWPVDENQTLIADLAIKFTTDPPENVLLDVDEDMNIPRYFHFQSYPNPFNPTVNMTYMLDRAEQVELKIFDLTGREVATLVNTFQQPGFHQVSWDATHLSSGIYIVRLKNNSGKVITQRITLLK